ncbi:putative malate dehydrogenase 1B isoform 1 [Schistosoma japonicum]|uniref:Putative malate dehydrogenase 1B isoform 1 n=1 Tax=Schistosoma japonicum TaxID=6182 RepID=A0A4Z2DMB7_SCHJA|nr:putative malate dehydrogenase 1B isoform 1 [Schistosoma japonicum]
MWRKSNCPFYARVELVADKLSLNLPNFRVTKIVKQPQDWKNFVVWVENNHGWSVKESPVIWRELVDQGGKGILIGGANEFQELLAAYYGEVNFMCTNEVLRIVEDNIHYKNQEAQEKQIEMINIIPRSDVIVIGAGALPTGNFLANILNGEIFGDEMINLYLNDEVDNKERLFELRAVLEESALPKLSEVYIIDDVDECLTNAKQVIILDVITRKGPNMPNSSAQTEWEPRNQWLMRRFSYFSKLGQKMKEKCPKSVRVLIAGNPRPDIFSLQMTTATCFDVTTLHRATKGKIPSSQIFGLVKPVELRIRAAMAKHLRVRTYDVTDVVVWGDLGGSIFLDLSRSCVSCRRHFDAGVVGGCHFRLPALSVAENPVWLRKDLLNNSLQENSMRQSEFVGICYENSITECLKECWNSHRNQSSQITSLVMISRDWYGVPEGVAFSFPVKCTYSGSWSIVEDILLTSEMEAKLKASIRSILEDLAVVDPLPLEKFLREGQKPKENKDDEYQMQDVEEN